ncbi:MAG: hypothetical protein NTX33_04795 [Propionibacteriales bacterium]|nr:hypothetical protein [Propionibacteriales bacterium]
MEIEVRGAHDLEALAKRLKSADDGKELRKQLLREIRQSAKPVIGKVKASARDKLPSRGGLADSVARSRIGVRTRVSGKNAGVRIEAKNGIDVRSLDRGRLRHPVFGNRNNWVNQEVEPGWFSEPLTESLPHVRRGVIDAMDAVAKRIEG